MALLAKILADEDNGFCRALEELALKKATNNEIFRFIKLNFDTARKKEDFVKENMKNFSGRKNAKFSQLDTSVIKLRRKYGNLKQNWRKITDKAKNGSGYAAEQEQEWYKFLNPIFAETNAEMELSSGKADCSFRGEYAESNSSDDGSESFHSSRDQNDSDGYESNDFDNNENTQTRGSTGETSDVDVDVGDEVDNDDVMDTVGDDAVDTVGDDDNEIRPATPVVATRGKNV